MLRPKFTLEKAKQVGDELHADWTKIELDQFRMGLETELEHGTQNPITNITNDDLGMTGKIALAHLNEIPDYYTRLRKMEQKGERAWARKQKVQDAKERYVKAAGEIRDEIVFWKNKIESVNAEISGLRQQMAEVDFSEMKKRFAKRADEYEALCRKKISELDELKQKILSFERKVELEFSSRRERIKRWVLRAKTKLSKMSDSYFNHWDKIVKEFQDFISEVQNSQVKHAAT